MVLCNVILHFLISLNVYYITFQIIILSALLGLLLFKMFLIGLIQEPIGVSSSAKMGNLDYLGHKAHSGLKRQQGPSLVGSMPFGIIGDKIMHSYITNSNEYNKVYLILSVLSILSAYGLGQVLFILKINFWWIDYPSVLGFYGFFFFIFNNYMWHTTILEKIKLVKTPDINGKWHGIIESSFDKFETKNEVYIYVTQNWTKISIRLKSGQSTSRSEVCGIVLNENGESTITYSYLNEPSSKAPETMQTHKGTIILTLNQAHTELQGDYYTGRGRLNYGTISLKRGSK